MRRKTSLTNRKYLRREVAARRASIKNRTASDAQLKETNEISPGNVDQVMPLEKSVGSSMSIPLSPLIEKLKTHMKDIRNDDRRKNYQYVTQEKSIVKKEVERTLRPALGPSSTNSVEPAVESSAQPVYQEFYHDTTMRTTHKNNCHCLNLGPP